MRGRDRAYPARRPCLDASACSLRRRHDLVPHVDAGRLRHSSHTQKYLFGLGVHTLKTWRNSQHSG